MYVYYDSGNAIGAEGWGAAAGLAGLTAMEPLGVAWRGLKEGRLESLELGAPPDMPWMGGKLKGEAGLLGVLAAGYLGRSASCLTRLDIRCLPLADPLPPLTRLAIRVRLDMGYPPFN